MKHVPPVGVLRDICRDLDARSAHTPETLAAALRRHVTIDDVAPWVRFSDTSYVRALVAKGRTWELRVHSWKPSQTSSLHGHGAGACAFRIVRGSARELVLGERDRQWAPGDVVCEATPDLVHQVGSDAHDPLITLHAYSPALPEQPPDTRGDAIVIVGGGFSGIAAAVHLLHRAHANLRVTVVEKGPWLGRGVAYGVDSKVFRLNVPASKMSLDHADPMDFVRWSRSEHAPHAFRSRSEYAHYVVERFGDAVRTSAGKLRVVRGDAVDVDDGAVVLADGTRLPARAVILATGLAPRLTPSSLPADPRIVDAWDECALACLPTSGTLLVLGSGLTALDVLAFLAARNFAGRVVLVSRRGLLPRRHLHASEPFEIVEPDSAPSSLPAVIRWVRTQIELGRERGVPWQSVIDALRPHTRALWRSLSPDDRARFVRSIRPYWEVLRHRAPPDVDDLVTSWRSTGKLDLRAGSIARCDASGRQLEVTLRRADGSVETHACSAIVRCIGPALDHAETSTPLMASLIASGRAVRDPAGLGIVTELDGRVRSTPGTTPPMFALGALRRASHWETTAVPEIVRDAAELAAALS